MKSNKIMIGLAQTNSFVGAIKSNAELILHYMEQMSASGVTLGLFPEGALCGYPPEELVGFPYFQESQLESLLRLVDWTGQNKSHTTFVVGGSFSHQGKPYNAAFVFGRGKLLGIVPKQHLPEYNVFHDRRVFAAGTTTTNEKVLVWGSQVPFGNIIFDAGFLFGVNICEDIWVPDQLKGMWGKGVDLVCNISASPFRIGIPATRQEMLSTRSSDYGIVLAYTSSIGGQGGLVFDGDGGVWDNGSNTLNSTRFWKEDGCENLRDHGWQQVVVDLGVTRAKRSQNTTLSMYSEQTSSQDYQIVKIPMATQVITLGETKGNTFLNDMVARPQVNVFDELEAALVTALHSYVAHTGAKRLAINSSGGKDSALVIVLAWLVAHKKFAHITNEQEHQAAIEDFVWTFSWPTRHNSPETKNAARDIAHVLGVSFHEESIEAIYNMEIEVQHALLAKDAILQPIAMQNIAAIFRMLRLSVWCNSHGALMLNTSNLSEKAMGYGTKRADMVGDYAPIINLPKTVIIKFLEHLAKKYHLPILLEINRIPASAELADDQYDELDLMPYQVLDSIIYAFLGDKLSPVDTYRRLRAQYTDEALYELSGMYEQGMLKIWVKKAITKIFHNVHKWITGPEGIHVASLDLDRERAFHLPSVSSLEWLRLDLIDQEPD